MTIRAIAAAAGLGLLAAGCNPTGPTPSEDTPPVTDQPAQTRPADPAFANAVSFACEGGGKVDVVFQAGSAGSTLASIDGGAPVTLAVDETVTDGMVFKDAAGSLTFDAAQMRVTREGGKVCSYVSRSLPAPAVDGVARNLGSEDAGASVEMKVGDKISVSLSGVPTAGYQWSAEQPPAFLAIREGPGGATSTDQFLPGFTGGNHWEVLIIGALAPGEAEISLVQKRPWENQPAPDDQRFKFRLKVS